ncbi:MAG: pyruvate carboxylase subunit B, partial [Gammaproteobacteria bacterium]|jgi:oxaloacetate decarboxylase alpha subunit
VHDVDLWVDMAKQLEDMGSHSICIKDMAGLLHPYTAEEMVGRIKESCSVPLSIHCHATTGLSTATLMKAIDAGVDMIDTSISSMSLTYGHSPTETFVAIMEESDRATGLDLALLEEISLYFREVRKKYAKFEGSLKGVDPRILTAQVPGGMLTNLENQLRDQNASDRLDEVLKEIPSVRKDLGYVPLVTPTSQIVGTQSVINVLSGERYKSISKETAGVLRGEYGATAAPVNAELQARVLGGDEPITCRPADLIQPEMDKLTGELEELARAENIKLADNQIDDVLIYALFQQVGINFLKNRGNPDAFEPAPDSTAEPAAEPAPAPAAAAPAGGGVESYRVSVNGTQYDVVVGPGDADISQVKPVESAPSAATTDAAAPAAASAGGTEIHAPLAGSVLDILVSVGQQVNEGDPVVIIEAMKMETEIRANAGGKVQSIAIKKGDKIVSDQLLMTVG